MLNPKIAFIVPAYNAERYIEGCIKSIIKNTLTYDSEIIIVDDGSSDSTGKIAKSVLADNRRHVVVELGENQGISYALNTGISISKADFIFRLDADDLLLESRVPQTLKFFENNPNVGIIGTGRISIDENNKKLKYHYPNCTHETIEWIKNWMTPFAHPTVAFRRTLFEEHGFQYNSDYDSVEDLELWSRVLNFTEGANLSLPGILYRVHNKQSTAFTKNNRLDLSSALLHERLKCKGIVMDLDRLRIHTAVFANKINTSLGSSDFEKLLEERSVVYEILYKTETDIKRKSSLSAGFGRDIIRLIRLSSSITEIKSSRQYLSLISGVSTFIPEVISNIHYRTLKSIFN